MYTCQTNMKIYIRPQVVGEYSYVHTDVPTEEILESITALLNRRFEEPDTHGWVVTAITKLVSQLGHLPESVYSHSWLSISPPPIQTYNRWAISCGYCITRVCYKHQQRQVLRVLIFIKPQKYLRYLYDIAILARQYLRLHLGNYEVLRVCMQIELCEMFV